MATRKSKKEMIYRLASMTRRDRNALERRVLANFRKAEALAADVLNIKKLALLTPIDRAELKQQILAWFDRADGIAASFNVHGAGENNESAPLPTPKQNLLKYLKTLSPEHYSRLRRDVFEDFAKANPERNRLGRPALQIVNTHQLEGTR